MLKQGTPLSTFMQIRKHLILLGILLALGLMVIATLFYPGGSTHNIGTPGFDWAHNYFSNLFSPLAVNSIENGARPWAIASMLVLCLSLGAFFISFAKKIPKKVDSAIIKYSGILSMIAGFFIVSPLHDQMIIVSVSLALVSLFYISVYIFKSKLHLLKVFSILSLLVTYGCNYVYFTSSYLEILPVLQKVTLFIDLLWILSIEYFSRAEDFKANVSAELEQA